MVTELIKMLSYIILTHLPLYQHSKKVSFYYFLMKEGDHEYHNLATVN